MFKRANKMTALLVAAAAVVSLVPATGVNAADVKRIESKDGTVFNVQAYKDGSFVIDGDVVKEDNDAIYYLKDGKYNELPDLDSGDDFEKVTSGKYLQMQNSDYFVDLSNGKVTDDNVREDNAEDAATALKKNVKKDNDGRYIKDADHKGSESLPPLKDAQIKGAKYGDTWYETQYTDKKSNTIMHNVYSDAKGKYIDADYNIGKLKIETTSGASVTLKNTDEDKLKVDDDVQVSVINDTNLRTIGQDANNIYRIVTLKVDYDNTKTGGNNKDIIKSINGVEVIPAIFDGAGSNHVSFQVIQKISKAQASDDINGAKYAKTVNTYLYANKDGNEKATLDSEFGTAEVSYSVANGKIIAYTTDTTKTAHNKDVIQTIELSSKSANYYTDIKDACTDDITAVDTDVDGNVWMVDGGFTYKWDNDEDWDKVYKVDGLMKHLSVYNKDNMAVWSDDDDEVYSIIGAKDKEDEKPVVATKGWAQATDGTWTYVNENGTKATGWLNLGGTWYYMNDNGVMATGWKIVNGTWYYLNDSGSMATGWKNLGGTWYFLDPSGAMKTGWYKDGDTWYYLNANGSMAANTTVDGCNLGANGAWI